MMLAAERQAYIMEQAHQHGVVRIAELRHDLHVSGMTIRRDLEALAARGLLEKVHGGAVSRHRGSTQEPGFEAKAVRERPEKEAIAIAAARLVPPRAAIGLVAGTTTWTLAHHLRGFSGTVVTNSSRVAQVFHQKSHAESTVVLTGGIRTPSDALVGPIANAALKSLELDLVIMGAHGMEERSGFTTPNLLEADMGRAFVRAGRQLMVLADHTKWGVVGISTFAKLRDADVLVTDAGLGATASAVLKEQVGELVVAPVDHRGDE